MIVEGYVQYCSIYSIKHIQIDRSVYENSIRRRADPLPRQDVQECHQRRQLHGVIPHLPIRHAEAKSPVQSLGAPAHANVLDNQRDAAPQWKSSVRLDADTYPGSPRTI